MRLAEGVVGERLDDVEQFGAQVGLVAVGLAAGHKLLPLGGNQRADLLATRLAQVVGLGERVASHRLGHPHHLLLVDHQAVGVRQHRLQRRVGVGDSLAPVLAVGVVVVGVGRHRARPVEGVEGGDVLEGRRRQRAHQRPHGPALQLEDPHGVPAAQHLESRRIVKGYRVDVRTCARRGLDQVQGALDHREVAQAQDVHLEQAQLLHPVHLVLSHHRGIGGHAGGVRLALDRQVLGERLMGNDHRGCVDAVLAAQPGQAPGYVDAPAGVRVGLVHLP